MVFSQSPFGSPLLNGALAAFEPNFNLPSGLLAFSPSSTSLSSPASWSSAYSYFLLPRAFVVSDAVAFEGWEFKLRSDLLVVLEDIGDWDHFSHTVAEY